jgi:hypothetical protein
VVACLIPVFSMGIPGGHRFKSDSPHFFSFLLLKYCCQYCVTCYFYEIPKFINAGIVIMLENLEGDF